MGREDCIHSLQEGGCMSFFDFQESDLSASQQDRKINPIIFEEVNPEIYIIPDHYLKEDEIWDLKERLQAKCSIEPNLKIIYPFKFKPNQKELAKQVSLFYRQNTIELNKIIPPNSKVVVFGRSINAITYNTDIDVEAFYDIRFNKQHFYSPDLKSYIFPTDSWYFWWGKDNWENHFAFLQLENAYRFQIPLIHTPVLKVIIPEDPNQVLSQNLEAKEVALDIETDGFNFMTNRIGCVTIAFNGTEGYYLDFKKIDKKLFSEFLKNKYQILANGKFDWKFLRYNGIENLKIDFDTMAAGHVLNEMRSNSLKTHSWLYTYYGGYELPLDDYMRKYKNTKSYLDIPVSILSDYAVKDAIITFQVFQEMKAQMKRTDEKAFGINPRWNLSKYYYDVMIPSLNMFAEMEYDGVHIDWDRVRKAGSYSDKIKTQINDIIEQLSQLFGVPRTSMNWSSNIQLAGLIEKKGWENKGLSKLGDYLVNEETLTEWAKEGHPEASLIIKYHELSTIMNTFIGEEMDNSGYWAYRYPDNKVHSTFAVMMADSGRNKSRNPNLQNIPKHGEYSELLRGFFVPPSDEYNIMECDASGFQIRVGAALSGDRDLRKAFLELGGDVHSMTAVNVLLNNSMSLEDFMARKKEKDFKEIRFRAKSCVFGFLFGASGVAFASSSLKPEWSKEVLEKYLLENNLQSEPLKLYKRIREHNMIRFKSFTLEDCKYWAAANDIRKKFFSKYRGLSVWHEKSREFAADNGYVASPFGCIRRLPQLTYQGNKEEFGAKIKNLQNISLNSPVQNFEAVLINSTMVKLHKFIKDNGLKSKVCMTIHDAIVVYLHKSETELIKKKIKEFFEEDIPENNGIPMVLEGEIAEISKGEVWGFGSESF